MKSKIAVAVTLLLTTGLASADGAVHFGPGCFTSTIEDFTFDYCFQDVITPSGNANAQFHGTLASPPPDRATTVRGFSCNAGHPFGLTTTNSKIVVTPSGQVNGTCKFRP